MNVAFLVSAATAGNSAFTGVLVYPIILPNDAPLPAITYQTIANVSQLSFSTFGAQRMRIQFDCWAMTYLAAMSLRSALINALNGFRTSSPLSDGTRVSGTALLQIIDDFVQEALQYRLSVEFYVFYTF